ncbi:MAG: PH domain-containing protein [Actinobacteria bacterium]|nr:PH domain-containing protein [Actinomycetota bacterium]
MLTRRDEAVLLHARRHGVVLARPLVQALALALAGALLLLQGWPLSVGGALALGLAAAVLLPAVWRWERTHLVVTEDKLYVVGGTLHRRAEAVRHARVSRLSLDQTLAGRLLGYGTLVAGELEIPYVAEPSRVLGLVEQLTR